MATASQAHRATHALRWSRLALAALLLLTALAVWAIRTPGNPHRPSGGADHERWRSAQRPHEPATVRP